MLGRTSTVMKRDIKMEALITGDIPKYMIEKGTWTCDPASPSCWANVVEKSEISTRAHSKLDDSDSFYSNVLLLGADMNSSSIRRTKAFT